MKTAMNQVITDPVEDFDLVYEVLDIYKLFFSKQYARSHPTEIEDDLDIIELAMDFNGSDWEDYK